MSVEKQCFIDDHCCPLNADFTINKNYDKERAYWSKVYDEEVKKNDKTRVQRF